MFYSQHHPTNKPSTGDSKSTTQKLSDETSSATGSGQEQGKTLVEQASEYVSSAFDQASQAAMSTNTFLR